MKQLKLLAALFAFGVALSGCDKETPRLPLSQSPASMQEDVHTLEYYQARADEIVSVDLAVLAEMTEKIIHEKPDITEAELREALFNNLRELKKQVDAGKVPLAKVSGSTALCSEELWLLLWNPWNVSPTKQASDDASNEARRQWPKDQYQTKADAFRHAFWNILLAKRISLTWAEKYTNAHEACHQGNLDKAMDLHNNYVGRTIYKSYSTKSESLLSSIVKNWLYKYVTRTSEMNTSSLVYIRR